MPPAFADYDEWLDWHLSKCDERYDSPQGFVLGDDEDDD